MAGKTLVGGRLFKTLVGVAVVLGSALAAAQQGARGGEWTRYGGDAGTSKYAPLDQINKGNVAQLGVAWRRPAVDSSITSRRPDFSYSNNFRATPLMIDGVLYSPDGIGLVEAFDPGTGQIAIRKAFDSAKLYAGPYLSNAPDLLIGYGAGYRTSWDAAKGVVAGAVFTDNVKPWSGDHCVDPRLVPGVFFCNRHVQADDPALADIAPTALRLFGIQPPAYMDGRAFEVALS